MKRLDYSCCSPLKLAGINLYLPLYRLEEFQAARNKPVITNIKQNEEYSAFCRYLKKPQYPSQYIADPKKINIILISGLFIILYFYI
jgi:hypothetical protein